MLQEDHKEIASGKKKDEEGYMARVELDQMERSIKALRKVIKSSDYQLPAWVQSKITRAADYIDTASEYMQSDEKIDEEISPTINPKTHKDNAKQEKIRALTKSSNSNEAQVAKSKLRPSAAVSLPSIKKEERSLVEKILEEEGCGCSHTKNVCNKTKKGTNCPVHGMDDCSVKEERDPKGPVQPYKSPEEISKKHGVPLASIKKQLEMGIKVEGEHTSDKTAAKITALQHLDEVPDYYTKLKKVETQKNVSESTRIKAQSGNIIAITVSWRGKYYYIQMFFPQLKLPSKAEITFEVQKIYPDARVIGYKIAELNPGEPFIQISNSPSKKYLLNNKTIGEDVNEDWQKINRKDKTDGLSQKAVNAYRKEHPGSKLQTAVTEKNPTGKRANRRSNFCSRMKGMKSKLTSSKTAKDPDSNINKALRRWRCK